jgi:2-hydroxy-3-keto-5-methylthiopentenyl-1-phosphate phosphatase
MSAPMREAIVCDFDGTATVEDLGDVISKHFAGYDVWREAQNRYKAGEFPFDTLLRRIFEPIRVEREELAAFAREKAVLREGFVRFVEACRATGRMFVLCSAGLDLYIHPVLERLPPELRRYVQVRANRAVATRDGMQLHFPGEGTGCGHCGSCKGPIVDDLRSAGFRVVVCGDGTTDRCAALRADIVFARGKLVQYCAAQGISHVPFESFEEVIHRLGLA